MKATRIILGMMAIVLLASFTIGHQHLSDTTSGETENDTIAIALDTVENVDKILHAIDPYAVAYFADQGVMLDSCAYLPLYQQAFGWIGTPYKFGKSSRKGVDCSSLVKSIYGEAFNRELSGTSRTLYNQCTEVAKEDLQEGDFVFFKINRSVISHIGIYLRDGYFVHASVKRGVMVNNLSEKYYRTYFFSGGRLEPLDDAAPVQ